MKTDVQNNVSSKADIEEVDSSLFQPLVDSPLIITNRLLLRCEVKNGTYIPTEILSFQKLIEELKGLKCSDEEDLVRYPFFIFCGSSFFCPGKKVKK